MKNSLYDKKTGVFFTEHSDDHYFDQTLSKAICDLFLKQNINTVYEYGCGNGLYSKQMIECGLDVDTSDGNPNTSIITNGISYCKDLTQPQNVSLRDAVLCLEVGEHIPRKFENIVLDNIFNSSKNLVVLSWAIEDQDGNGHVNCRNNEYIINQAKLRGFTYQKQTSVFLRNVSTLRWFKNTIMVFKKLETYKV